MCGMCLPQCPTYQLYQNETESPRGRIALMQAIDQGRIDASKKALLHIDHCLSCLNCESICPSRVPYGKLIDEFRSQHSRSIKKTFTAKIILKQAAKPNGISQLAAIASSSALKPFTYLANSVGSTTQNPFTQPALKLKSLYSGNHSSGEQCRGELELFTGCSGAALDYQVISDTIDILNQLKFDVYISEQQNCCGALHQHNGQQKTASQLLDHCQKQLKPQRDRPLLFFSPTCGDRLKQIDNTHIIDARQFLLGQLQQYPVAFSTSDQPVALHESCSHRNRLKSKSLNTDLLNCIPKQQIIESNNPNLCCGAGGIQSINYPEQADALLQGKLKSFALTQTNILISDNIGCSLHIKTTISAYNPNIEIMHPISFLVRQLS